MSELLQALRDPSVGFLRYALVAGLLASVAFGMIGTYVVVRRISYIAGAIAHCVLGGIGGAVYLQRVHGVGWFGPMLGATIAALLAALIIGLVSLYAKQREDTVIGALWAAGMAAGLLFLARTPGYGVDPMNYLFGNILLISRADIWIVVALDLVVVGTTYFFYNKLLAVCFDEEFARLRNVRAELYYLLLLCLTALTVVLLVRIVGIVMVIALLTIPAAVANHLVGRLSKIMLVAIGFCMVFITVGLGVSYVNELPTGPTIIIVASVAYLVVLVIRQVRQYLRHRRLQEAA